MVAGEEIGRRPVVLALRKDAHRDGISGIPELGLRLANPDEFPHGVDRFSTFKVQSASTSSEDGDYNYG
jgi:hypothetical protein